MSKILFFGDVHFSDGRRYHYDAGNAFIDWVKTLDENSPNNTAILLGDLVEDFLMSGLVADQLHRLFETFKFKHVYVLVGNHDLKTRRGVEHLAYEFLENYKNVTLLRKPADILQIDGYSCLSFPHYNHINGLSPMYDYYNSLHEQPNIKGKEFDFIIGHFTDSTCNAFHSKTVDLSKLKAKKIVLGHIHTRTSPHYIGSIYPLNPTQVDLSRTVWVLDQNKWSEIPMPEFLSYKEVTFPEALPDHKGHVAWTIYNCYDTSLIDTTYGSAILPYIRQINVKPKAIDKAIQKKADFTSSSSTSSSIKPLDLLNELLKSNNTNYYNRGAVSILRKLLTT